MQATWLDTGMPVLFTTALAVCSLEPVTTITIQGVFHVLCGVLLSVCNVARDVNLSDILQPSLCDVTCETVTDLMTAHVYARRGLCSINVLGVDLVTSPCDDIYTSLSCADLFHVCWIMLLVVSVYALIHGYHHLSLIHI